MKTLTKTLTEACLLNPEQIAFLKAYSPPRIFNVPEALVYKGQVPLAGYVLLKGKITLEKNKISEVIPENSLIGARELLNNIPVKNTITIHPNSTVLILDKTSIFELMDSPKGSLFKPEFSA